MIVANGQLSICLSWLMERGLVSKALGGALDSCEGDFGGKLQVSLVAAIGLLQNGDRHLLSIFCYV